MNYYPLALVILLAFAGGWTLRGAFDVWRAGRQPVELLPWHFATALSPSEVTSGVSATITLVDQDVECNAFPPLRAVD